MKRFALILVLIGSAFAQTHIFPAEDTNNTFMGTNIFNGVTTFNANAIFNANSNFSGINVLSNPGTFVSGTNYFYNQSLVNNCNPNNELGLVQTGNNTDALIGCMAVPNTSTMHQADAISGFANSSSASTNVTGLYTQCRGLVTGSRCWGSNQVAIDTVVSGSNAGQLKGDEVDIQPSNGSAYYATIEGLDVIEAGTGVGQMPGAMVRMFVSSTPPFVSTMQFGLQSNDAGIGTGIDLGALCASGSCSSQAIQVHSWATGSRVAETLQGDSAGNWLITPAGSGGVVIGGNLSPSVAGADTLGLAARPFSSTYIGGAATNNIQLTGTATGARTATLPDASITVSGAVFQDCGSTSGATQACAGTVKPTFYVVRGDVTLNSAATQSITTLPFTGAANFSCSGSDLTNAAGIISFNTYAFSVTASVTVQESGGGTSDHIRWQCAGF